ncbi:hypothetical protein K9L67_03570 [Candidatus Woesearchaeota archaeon]|nr:hypothetical protein [Candidatus Woesearchaeota archaeon]MCF7901280.1 hypothetical protein [Candidatus Woesearchaeota archaeon]MCF8013553.1 hypothetical protein [Candidatus Woesearchaeota archaeon]
MIKKGMLKFLSEESISDLTKSVFKFNEVKLDDKNKGFVKFFLPIAYVQLDVYLDDDDNFEQKNGIYSSSLVKIVSKINSRDFVVFEPFNKDSNKDLLTKDFYLKDYVVHSNDRISNNVLKFNPKYSNK